MDPRTRGSGQFGVGITGVGVGTQAEIDAGLRTYMLRVYNYMASGLLLTGIVSYLFAQWMVADPAVMQAVFGTPLRWVIFLAPLGMVFFLAARINSLQPATAQALFWVYAAMVGVSISSIFIVYTGESIVRAFVYAAATFGAMSLYGYTTKRDLSGFGSFLFMGLIGIIIAAIVNIFLGSSTLQWVISVLGVLIFTGLTAYDTQAIKEMYHAGDGAAVATKKSIMGALKLYLDFLNLFLMLLYLFGNRD